jgi:hypothetical protein
MSVFAQRTTRVRVAVVEIYFFNLANARIPPKPQIPLQVRRLSFQTRSSPLKLAMVNNLIAVPLLPVVTHLVNGAQVFQVKQYNSYWMTRRAVMLNSSHLL